MGLGHGRSFGWLAVGWLVGWWVGGLVDWLIGWLVGWLVGWVCAVPVPMRGHELTMFVSVVRSVRVQKE